MLHLSGIYFLWAYAFSTYWWALFHYANPVLLDYVFYVGGLTAWTLRAAAWGKRRSIAAVKANAEEARQPAFRMAGIVFVGIGVTISLFGSAWKNIADETLYGYGFTLIPELYLPFWPFEPFLPLAVILGGIYLATLPAGGAELKRSEQDASNQRAV